MVARYKPNTKRRESNGKRVYGRPFPKGEKPKGAGRRKGSGNKVPALLKDAVMLAAEAEGMNKKGLDGLVGFLRDSARTERAAFLGLMGKILPLQINAKINAEMTVTGKYGKADIKSMSLEEKQVALAEILGLTRPLLAKPVGQDDRVTDGEFTEIVKEAAE